MTKLISAAAVLAMAAGANATVIYSTSFEQSEGFVVGGLNTQGTPPYAVTSTSYNVNNAAGAAKTGTQYARIAGSSTSTNGAWAWADSSRTAAQLASAPIIRASMWVNLTTSGAIGTRLYGAGMDLYDITGGSRVGAIRINIDGSVSVINGLAVNQVATTAANFVALNTWHKLTVEADFSLKTLAFSVNGVALGTPVGFGVFEAGITGFGDADLYSVRGSTGTTTITENRFDDLVIEQIPAPGALALIGLGGLVAARRRRA